jgi:hypothetical protein
MNHIYEFITANQEFLAATANVAQACLWIYLFWLLTSVSRDAFMFLAKIAIVIYLIHTIYITNKTATVSKMYNNAVLEPVAKIDPVEAAGAVSNSFWSLGGWIIKKVTWS